MFYRGFRRKTDNKSVRPCKKVDKDEKLQSNSGQTPKNTKKDIKTPQKSCKNNGFLNLKKSQKISNLFHQINQKELDFSPIKVYNILIYYEKR